MTDREKGLPITLKGANEKLKPCNHFASQYCHCEGGTYMEERAADEAAFLLATYGKEVSR